VGESAKRYCVVLPAGGQVVVSEHALGAIWIEESV
jgi:hypothetical protein